MEKPLWMDSVFVPILELVASKEITPLKMLVIDKLCTGMASILYMEIFSIGI